MRKSVRLSTRLRLLAALAAPLLLLLLLLGPLRESLSQSANSSSARQPPVLPQPARGGTRGPSALVFRPDGSLVYVAEQDENDVAVFDADTGKPLAHIPSGGEQPTALALAPDNKTLVVANAFSGTVGVLNSDTRSVIARISLRGEPSGVVITRDNRAWVSVAQCDQVAVIDLSHLDLSHVDPAHLDPAHLDPAHLDPAHLDPAHFDASSAKITQRISVGRGPRVLALTPDGKTLVCANALGGSLSLIDIKTGVERGRIALPAINLRGMAFAPDGTHVYVTGQQPHNDLPTDHTETMWSNVLCVVRLEAAGTPHTDPQKAAKVPTGGTLERMLTLDRPDYGASDPCGIVLDVAGTTAFVTLSGTHEIAIVPLGGETPKRSATSLSVPTGGSPALPRAARSEPPEAPKSSEPLEPPLNTQATQAALTTQPNAAATPGKRDPDLAFKSDGGPLDPDLTVVDAGAQVRRVHVGCNPRALALRPHSTELWVGNHLGNSLYALPDLLHNPGDNAPASPLQTPLRIVDLGAPTPSPNRRLRGRFFFASAHVTRGQFFSCESCHPSGGTDGLSWKFAHVKDGLSARNTKDLRGMLLLTAPYGWGGREEDFEVFVHDEVGGLLRTRKLEHPEVHALWDLVNETPLPPNPYRKLDGALTEAAERGKALFTTEAGCVHCHVGEMHGGTKKREWIGTTSEGVTLDVPHLVGVYESAPYLHDGRAATLEEIFTKHNTAHRHGSVDSLTQSQLHDLLEYVREL